jgi:CHAT domain-containing protein/tetratricopeptide (TPR) repeat protein
VIASLALCAGAAEQPPANKPTFEYRQYRSIAELTNAVREIKQRLDAAEEKFGSNSTNVAKLLSDLGECYSDLGEDAQALHLSQRSLSIREALLGPEHEAVAEGLRDLAWDYWGVGNYEQAQLLFQRSLAITEKRLGLEHFELATTLNDLADLYREQGDFARALPLCRRALAIRQKVLGPQHPDVADSLTTLAQILRGLGEYREALDACQRSLGISGKLLDPDHPLLADALFVMGGVLSDLREFPEAQSACQRALLIDEKISGRDHPAAIEDLNELAVLFGRQSRWDRCLLTAAELCSRERRHIISQALALPDSDALRFIQYSIESAELLHSACARCSPELSESARRTGAEALALSKAFLEEVRAGQTAFEIYSDMATRALQEQCRAVQVQLERLPKSGLDPAERDSRLRSLQTDLGHLEQQLSERFALLAQTLRDRTLTLAGIARNLPPQAALADFVRYRRYDFAAEGTNQWKEERYAVYLTHAPTQDSTNLLVERVDLGAAAPINEAVDIACRRMSAGQYAVKDLPSALHRVSELVYAPLAKYLTNVSHLIVCPDGELSRLPFEMLSHEGRFLIEEKTISYVGSGREVARAATSPRSKVQSSTPLVMGNPDFDLDLSAPSVVRARAHESETDASLPKPSGLALTRTLSRDYGGMKFKPLPGSEVEARSIAKLLGEDTILKIGADAREAELKAVMSPRVLHLATHGFFLSDQEVRRAHSPTRDSLLSGGFARRTVRNGDWENPLVRCGIALAGANHASQLTNAMAEDGLLTGLEASLLNLQGTELVILSACDSGTGEVRTGEGVMSLRRAFRIAGAETVLASHWKVNDAATRRLMTDFIRRWRSGDSRAEAWRRAQLSLLHSEEFANPYFWAAFTLTGDWR